MTLNFVRFAILLNIIFCADSYSELNNSVFYEKLNIEERVSEYFSNDEYLSDTDLCLLMKNCGSDKGVGWHNYTTLYSKLFDDWKLESLNIFELGIGSINPNIPSNMGIYGTPGASLIGWSEYFSKSKIYGADIDKDILFTTDRIKTFFCDQCDSITINQMFLSPPLCDVEFDLIIDDGYHDFFANKIFLENSIKKLKKGGVYIVEDLLQQTENSFKKILPELKSKYSLDYIEIFEIPSKVNFLDNRILIIQK